MFNQSHKCYHHKSFEKTLKILQKKLPPAYKVKVKYVEDETCWASVNIKYYKNGRPYFEMTVGTWQCEDMAIESLHHEWAHMLSWAVGNNWQKWQDTHGPEFGVAWAKIYQVLVEK